VIVAAAQRASSSPFFCSMAGHSLPVGDDALSRSEQKRMRSLELLEEARRFEAAGDTEAAVRNTELAWTELEASLKICPWNHRARFLLVSCAMNADNYERANKEGMLIYKELSRDQLCRMNDAVLHLSLAHASKMLGRIDEAKRFALEASQLYGDDPHPHMILGELYEASGQDAEAEATCRQALLHNEKDSCKHKLTEQSVYFTLCCLGASLIKQRKLAEAEQSLQRAVRLDPESTLAQRHLIDVYHFQQRWDEAMALASKVVEMDPDDREIREKLEILQNTPKQMEVEPSSQVASSTEAPLSGVSQDLGRNRTASSGRPDVPPLKITALPPGPGSRPLPKSSPGAVGYTTESLEEGDSTDDYGSTWRTGDRQASPQRRNSGSRTGAIPEENKEDVKFANGDGTGKSASEVGSATLSMRESKKILRIDEEPPNAIYSHRSHLEASARAGREASTRKPAGESNEGSDWFFCCFDRDTKGK